MRNIFIVNATQTVTSDAHPEGVYSTLPDYPKTYDSRSYGATEANPNGDDARALEVAQAEFYSRVSAFLAASSPTRVMWTVTLTRADGRQIMRESRGAFPDMTPQPEPQPEQEPEEPIIEPEG